MNSYAKTAARMTGRALAAVRHWGRQAYGRSRPGLERVRQLANVDAQAPADPLLEDGGATPARHRQPGLLDRLGGGLPVAGLGPRHLSDPDRPDADRAAQRDRARRAVRQPAAGDRHGGGDRRAGRRPVAGLAQEGGRRAPACAHRAAVQPDHGAAGAAARGCRHHHVLALARQLVQPPDHDDRDELARCGPRLPGGARPGHPHRHRQHGQRPRRCGGRGRQRPAQVPRADVRAGGLARPAGRLRRRCQGQREGGGAGGRAHPLHCAARASDPRRRGKAMCRC